MPWRAAIAACLLWSACSGPERATPEDPPQTTATADTSPASSVDSSAPHATAETATTADTASQSTTAEPDLLTVTSWSDRTGPDGLLQVPVSIAAGDKSFQVSLQGTDVFVGVERVLDPDGVEIVRWQDWWASDESLTGAVYGWADTTSFNWPVRPEDGELEAGDYIVEVYTVDPARYYVAADLQLDVFVNRDPDPAVGEVHVDVYWASGVQSDPVVDATEAAVAVWQGIYSAVGLTVVPHYLGELDVDAQMAFVTRGSEEVALATTTKEPNHLVMVVGEGFGTGSYAGYYGVSGGIPGTLAASPRTWVAVSWLAFAGVDGEVDDDEAGLMGVTMAHEAGHYVGLFHPVECPKDCGGSWDALADTPRCEGWEPCAEQIGSNLMFPYTICEDGACLEQHDLTADQQHVVHRYAGVL